MTALIYRHTSNTMPKRGEVLPMDREQKRFWTLRRTLKENSRELTRTN
jgi:hypothetical protein